MASTASSTDSKKHDRQRPESHIRSQNHEVDNFLSLKVTESNTKSNPTVRKNTPLDFKKISHEMAIKIDELERLKSVVSMQLTRESQKIGSSISQVIFDLKKWQTSMLETLDKQFTSLLTGISEQQGLANVFKTQADTCNNRANNNILLSSVQTSIQGVNWLSEDKLQISHVVLNWDKTKPQSFLFFESFDFSDSCSSIGALDDFKSPMMRLTCTGMAARRKQLAIDEPVFSDVKDFQLDTFGLGQSRLFGEESNESSLIQIPPEQPSLNQNSCKKSLADTNTKRKNVQSVINRGLLNARNLRERQTGSTDSRKSVENKSKNGIPKNISKTCFGFAQTLRVESGKIKAYSRRDAGTSPSTNSGKLLAAQKQLSVNKSCERLTCQTSLSSKLTTGGSIEVRKSPKPSGSKVQGRPKAIIEMKHQETDDIYYEYLRGKLNLGKQKFQK